MNIKDIDKNKLGILEYGLKIEKNLKEKYKGKKIVDVQYNNLNESFEIVLNNGEILTLFN